MGSEILTTENLTKQFGGLVAVNEISCSFDRDQVTSIIGPNGAGKTTFFNLLTGALAPTSGNITFQGNDITAEGMTEVARRGILRSYQTTTVFEELSVFENVRIAVQQDEHAYTFWKAADDIDEINQITESLLDRLKLIDKSDKHAGELSHGDRRKLEVAIALGGDPQLLLLDEPSSGMSPEETKEIIQLVDNLSAELPIILIEHKMSIVMEVADRILVLHEGSVIADGTPAEIRSDSRVQEVYLGGVQT